MDIMDAILGRRSIRKYTTQPVPEGLIEELLKAAMYAPSAGNERPWHFIVLTERAILDAVQKFHPHSAMLKTAPCAVLICADANLEKHKGYWVQDCSAATQNLLLAAHGKGLGAVWCGVYPREDRIAGFSRLLNIPDHVMPFSLVPLGYPEERPSQPERFDASRIHKELW